MDEVAALVENNQLADAADRLRQDPALLINCDEAVWRILFAQTHVYRFDRASRFLQSTWPLLRLQEVTTPLVRFVSVLLTNWHLNLAVQWSQVLVQLNPGNRPNPVDCIAYTIDRGNYDLALKAISELPNPASPLPFNLPQLILGLVQQNNFAAARKWSQKFNLERMFPAEELCERMLQHRQWDNALSVMQLGNQKRVPVDFIKRVAVSRDWSSALKFASAYNTTSSSVNRTEYAELVLFLVIEMLKDGCFVLALKQVFQNAFLLDVPGVTPKDIVRRMVQSGDAGALRMMAVLELDASDVGGGEAVIDSLQQQRWRRLTQFRQLAKLRAQQQQQKKKRSVVDQQPMVVTACEQLGTHYCADTSTRSGSGGSGTLRAMTIDELELMRRHLTYKPMAAAADDDDDGEEEILFVAKPKQTPPPLPPQPQPQPSSSADRFQQQMQAVFKTTTTTPVVEATAPPRPVHQYQPPTTTSASSSTSSSRRATPSPVPPMSTPAPIAVGGGAASSARPKKAAGFLMPSQLC